jgi:hypothetical protein
VAARASSSISEPYTQLAFFKNAGVIALPVAAIFIAAMTNVGLPCRVLATMALAGGMTSFQALFEAHWSVPQSRGTSLKRTQLVNPNCLFCGCPSSFEKALIGLGRGYLHPRRGELYQICLQFRIPFIVGQAGALGSTLKAFPRVPVHGGNLMR